MRRAEPLLPCPWPEGLGWGSRAWPKPLAGEGTCPAPGSWGLRSVLYRKADRQKFHWVLLFCEGVHGIPCGHGL